MVDLHTRSVAGTAVTNAEDEIASRQARVRGQVIRRGAAGYDEARKVYNGMIDRRSALIVRCTDVANVISGVKFGREQQTIGVILAVLGSVMLVLAACARLPFAPAPSTAAPASSGAGDFVGSVPEIKGGVVLSSSGQQLVAYLCNGTSVVQWFRGPVRANAVDVTGANGLRLTASFTEPEASGQLTLSTGQVVPLTVSRLPAQTDQGLYRGEETFNGVHYIGGWVYEPAGSARSRHLVIAAIGLPGLESASASQTLLKAANAIENAQTGAILAAPALTAQDVASRRVDVPDLGVFHLTHCQLAACN